MAIPGQLPPPPSPLVLPPNGPVTATTTTSTNNTGAPNTPPVVQQKVPKSEFKRLTNEWNETHEKLTENFRELNVIFADIKFLLQQLESQLKAAGIKSDISHCVVAADSCIESFANANANASSLDIHINNLDKNVFNNAPQDIQDTFKKLTKKVAEAGNLGKAIGIPGSAQNASATQSTSPAAPTGAVKQSTSPTEQLSSVIQGCKKLLPEIERNVSKIEGDINSVNGKIKGLKNSPQFFEEGSKKYRADLEKVYTKWKATKDLFDKEKKKNDAAITFGASPNITDQQNYKLRLDELKNQSSAALLELADILKRLEKIETKTQSMSVDLKQLGDDKNEINTLLGSIQLSSFDAHIDLNDSLQKINQSNLGKKGKKEIDGLITAFDEKDNRINNHDDELQLIEDELTRLNKFLVKISGKIGESKSACEKMIVEIRNENNGFIWL